MMGNSRPLKPQVESENKIESTTQKVEMGKMSRPKCKSGRGKIS
jgi:hypothetical protein